jgi:hypothetical protein
MEILETAGRYRLRLSMDTEPANPRRDYDHISRVITVENEKYADIDENGGPLQYGWDYFSDHENGDDLFIRWARMAHGAVVVQDSPHDGARSFWYLMPDGLKEVTDPLEFLAAEIREYRAWAEGDVWGHIIEKSVRWQRCETAEDESMITWEEVESCWGYIGREYAEREARESFVPYKMEAQA